jgi:DNA-binding Xre family transcriptional regulator
MVVQATLFIDTLFSPSKILIINKSQGGITMVRLRVEEILKEQGKTRYWLNKRMEMHYVSFKNMIENNTTSIRFETLDKLSTLLDVPIGDLFEKTDDSVDN